MGWKIRGSNTGGGKRYSLLQSGLEASPKLSGDNKPPKE
jgi:hypothetical protein